MIETKVKCEGCDGMIPIRVELREDEQPMLFENGHVKVDLHINRDWVDVHLTSCEGLTK